MVTLPASALLMGSDNHCPEERPAHEESHGGWVAVQRDLTAQGPRWRAEGTREKQRTSEKQSIEKLLEDGRNQLSVFVRTVPRCPHARCCL